MNLAQKFLQKNREKFASADGLPGDFHREQMFALAKPGKTAGIVTPQGNVLCGRVVMKFATHAVLNLGGAHGTPGVMEPHNCVFVAGAAI